VDQGGGPATQDAAGHGTHTSSLACAASNNGVGLAGTGYDCRLIVERTDFSETSIASSIVDATDNGADAISMSFGDDGSTAASYSIRAAVDYAFDREVVLVAAAANDPVEEQGQPANMLQPTGTGPDLGAGKGLSVTAANFANARTSFAGRGTQISLAAYGSFGAAGPRGLFAAFPGNLTEIETGLSGNPPTPPCPSCRTTFVGDSRYAYLLGTSAATPQVAAIAALVKRLNPDLSASEIVRLLKETATNPGWEPELGWGIVDAGAAVEAARKIDRVAPTSRLRAPRRSGSPNFRLTWKGSDPAGPGLIPSGVGRYEVFAASSQSRDGRFRRIAKTKGQSVRFTGKPGARYRFYTVAIDRSGNRESKPSRADASTRVAQSSTR
ncbi:MAG: S8 family peptidase, partial [Solirubrobacteraceae bacterium]